MTAPEQKLVNDALVIAQQLVSGTAINVDSPEARKLIVAAQGVCTQNSLTLQNAASTATGNL